MILTMLLLFGFVLMSYEQPTITSDSDCEPERNPSQCNTEVFPLEKCDQEICGNDKMCKQYHSISDNLIYHPYLAVRNVTEESINPTSLHINYQRNVNDFSNNSYIRNECLETTRIPTLNLQLANESSFSPWEYVINRDENRIPRDILETRCICVYCINPGRTAYHSQYVSKPLKVTRYFHLKGRGEAVYNAEFSYGCICEYGGLLPN